MNFEEKIEEIVKRYPQHWKTKSQFMTYIRGGIRSGLWNKNKIKLGLSKSTRQQIPNPNPKGKKPTVWGNECSICKNLFPEHELQVDHIRERGSSLRCFDDIQQFIADMILVTEDDLRLVCKPCHNVVNEMQKKGLSFEQAKIEKEYIAICKDKQKLVDALSQMDVKSIPKTQKAQKELLRELMFGENT